MVAFNFQSQFADDVEKGRKLQTIRAPRKSDRKGLPYGQPCAVGEALQLYTGMRTKQCRKLGDAECVSVMPIGIFKSNDLGKPYMCKMKVHGEWEYFIKSTFYSAQAEALAKADGFESLEAMVNWFDKTHGVPFFGYLIRWYLEP